jgi:hypothetical protein
MIKIVIFSFILCFILFVLIKNFSKINLLFKRLLNNSIFRALIFRGLWRLIKLLIFKR